MAERLRSAGSSELRGLYGVAIGLAIVARLAFFAVYSPTRFGDSASYVDMGRGLLVGDMSVINGVRTPMYPFLVGVLQGNGYYIWIVQAILGALAAALVYRMALALTASDSRSFIVSVVTGVGINFLSYEATVLTESLSLFLVVLVAWVAQSALKKRLPANLMFLVGALTGCLILTRPAFIAISLVVPALPLLVNLRARERCVRATIGSLPILVLVLTWSQVVYSHTGVFAPTITGGCNLVQHVGPLFTSETQLHPELTRIYLKHRQGRLDRAGTSCQAIWPAVDEARRAYGITLAEASRRYGELSIAAIREHPVEYMRSVGLSFIRFFGPTAKLDESAFRYRWAGDLVAAIWLVEKWAMALGVILAVVSGLRLLRRKSVSRGRPYRIFLASMIMAAALPQAFVESGDNGRFGVPTFPLVMVLAAAALDFKGSLYLPLRRDAERSASTTCS